MRIIYSCFFRYYFFIAIIIIASSNYLHAQKTIEVDSTVYLIDGFFNQYNSVGPGDTLVLKPGHRSLLIIRNLNGTSEKPITIKNGKGIVDVSSNHYFGISIRQCNHIVLSGRGDSSIKYGIQISNIQGSGLSVGDYSSNFEIENIQIKNVKYSGIVAKTEPDCDFERSSFLQENTIIHDCYIYNSGNEGMYIGSSFYNGQTLQCNGISKIVFPPLLKNVDIYDNLVEYAGWDGIQVSSAINTKIHKNIIRYDSQAEVSYQMTGITLGGGSTGSIYNNLIKDGEGTGIFSNGLGDINIYNNIILNPGKTTNEPSGNYGMYFNDQYSWPSMYFNIYNNLIINPKKTGVRFLCELSTNKNLLANNIIIKNNAIVSQNQETQFIDIIGKNIQKKTNYFGMDIKQLFFCNPDSDNYNLTERSPLIDGGSKILNSNFIYDFNENTRELGSGIDIGPNESPYYRILNTSNTDASTNIIYPNPVEINKYYTILFNNEMNGYVVINLIDFQGKIIKQLSNSYMLNGNQIITLEAKDLNEGLNYIQVSKTTKSNILKLFVTTNL